VGLSGAIIVVRDGAHSPLILAALMIGHHFSISALCRLASACGVCCSRGEILDPRSRFAYALSNAGPRLGELRHQTALLCPAHRRRPFRETYLIRSESVFRRPTVGGRNQAFRYQKQRRQNQRVYNRDCDNARGEAAIVVVKARS
jgi:hypothetical protein